MDPLHCRGRSTPLFDGGAPPPADGGPSPPGPHLKASSGGGGWYTVPIGFWKDLDHCEERCPLLSPRGDRLWGVVGLCLLEGSSAEGEVGLRVAPGTAEPGE